MEEPNQALMDKIEEIKAHIREELNKVESYLNKDYQDFSPELQQNYNFTQGLMYFVLFQDIFAKLGDYLKDQMNKYAEIERAEIQANRYNPKKSCIQ